MNGESREYCKLKVLPLANRNAIVLNALAVLNILLICIAVSRGGRTKGRCRECSADQQADKAIDPADGVKTILLTNRYFVNREP